MRGESAIAAAFIALWVLLVGLGLAYMVAIIWAIIKVTNHFAP